MTAQELATSNTEKIPFVTAILNNGYLGMVRQWQELFFDERYSGVYLDPNVPDYVKLAEAYGAVGLRVDSPEEVDAAIEKAYSIDDRSVVIDFRVDPREMVFPMVPAGASNDDIILGPEFAPTRTRRRHRSYERTIAAHDLGAGRGPARRAHPRGRACSPRAGTTSIRSRSAPPRPRALSRMTIVVNVEDKPLEQVTKQLNKLINVIKILEHDPGSAVERELMLVEGPRRGRRPRAHHGDRDVFRVNIVDVTATTLTRRGRRQAREARGAAASCSTSSASWSSRAPAGSRSARGDRGIKDRSSRSRAPEQSDAPRRP